MSSALQLVAMFRQSPRRLNILCMDSLVLLIDETFTVIHSGICVTWNVLRRFDFVLRGKNRVDPTAV